jgi:uncharacterized membrane protein YgaE (UPF0421/DUF939 family)
MPQVPRFEVVNRRQLLLAARAGVAAGLAWAAALPVAPNHLPYLAPISAVLVVQPTVFDTLSRAGQRVGGVLVGVVAALALARFVPIDAWIVGVVAFVGLLVGLALRLGPQGALQVPISALLVLLVGSITPGYGGARLGESLIGAAIGAVVALLSPAAPSPRDAMTSATDTMRDAADLLHHIGTELGSAWSPDQAEGWQGLSSGLVDEARNARERLEAERLTTRWNAMARRARQRLDQVEDALVAAERVTIQVQAIARALEAGADEARPLPRTGRLLCTTGQATRALAVVADSDGDPVAVSRLADALRQADEALRATLERAQHAWGDDPAEWLTFGLALAATQRILGEVSRPLDRLPGNAPFGLS